MRNRYLVLTELFLPTKGGTAVWFDEVYRRLGGKEIHIPDGAGSGRRRVRPRSPQQRHRLSLQRVGWLRPESLGMYLRFLVCALRLALTRRFDAIHAGRALPEGLVKLARRPPELAPGRDLRPWRRAHRLGPQQQKYKAMCFALRHADRVIANSDFTRDTLVGMGSGPSASCSSIRVSTTSASPWPARGRPAPRASGWAIRHG